MTLLVTADRIGLRLSLPYPLPGELRPRIELAIEDAQDKVLGFLNRESLAAEQRVVQGLYPDQAYTLTDKRAWPQVDFNDRYRVVSYVANAQDPALFDVTFAVGLDVANDAALKPILSFIEQDATEGLRNDPAFCAAADVARTVTSVSADGQSISYDKGSTAPGATGARVTLDSLKRWKRMAIAQPNYPVEPPWPYAYRTR